MVLTSYINWNSDMKTAIWYISHLLLFYNSEQKTNSRNQNICFHKQWKHFSENEHVQNLTNRWGLFVNSFITVRTMSAQLSLLTPQNGGQHGDPHTNLHDRLFLEFSLDSGCLDYSFCGFQLFGPTILRPGEFIAGRDS